MTKRSTRRIAMYADVQAILDKALAAGGGEVTLESYGKAVHWRQRAYEFRKLYAETVSANSLYDRLTMKRIAPDSTVVVIDVIQQNAIFSPKHDGIPILSPAPTGSDELLKEAEELARELGIDI